MARLAAALILSLGAVTFPAPDRAAAAMTVQRFGGADRYATAAAVSAAHFAPGVPAVYIATGAGYPDALAGGPAAALAGAPILLVTRWSIPSPIAAELNRLKPGRIVVLGGGNVISDNVARALDGYDTGGGVQRIGGADRYATAAAVSRATFAPGTATVYVATGSAFPDALVGGVAAARASAPVLLTKRDGLPAATEAEIKRLAPVRIVILGGTAVVNEAVGARLRTLVPSGGVSRLAGADRYATGVAVSRASFASAPVLFVATGTAFPDALVAVPAAARAGGALLLVPGTWVPPAVRDEAVRLKPGGLTLLGGRHVLNDRVTFDLRVALGDLPPLPACSYQDVLTPYRAYADWQRTLVDTILMVPSSYAPGDLVDSGSAGLNGGYALRSLVAADLRAMASAAQSAGRPIQVASAYRSYSTQKATFDHWVAVGGYEQALRTSARPGHSEHQLGTTFDFTSRGGRPPWEYSDWAATPAGGWMAANAWRYGFVMSYPRNSFDRVCYDYEPWHYRYVGRSVAAEVRHSGLTLREWLWLNGSGG
ncbi:MAG: cell wall-binding repeat-containing protein [Chloroflexi bacterium]|nr:cell wall-binding repeat-containing protein [Chloroflexota bacterium]